MSIVRLHPSLTGLHVLAVEDESLVAMYLEDLLTDLGCEVIGPAARVEQALQLLADHPVQAAVLDVNIAGEPVFPVADELCRAGIPFVFATGYGIAGVAERHRDRVVLQKPYSSEGLKRALESIL